MIRKLCLPRNYLHFTVQASDCLKEGVQPCPAGGDMTTAQTGPPGGQAVPGRDEGEVTEEKGVASERHPCL